MFVSDQSKTEMILSLISVYFR